MPTLTKTVHVSELPPRFREGREHGFVTLTITDVETPSDEDKLAALRDAIALGDHDFEEGHESPAEDVFARLRSALPKASSK